MLCKISRKQYKNIKALGCHISKTHHTQAYYYIFYKTKYDGICKYCGKDTLFINIDRGYKKFCNNICKNKHYVLENNPFYGRKHSYESLLKIKNRYYPSGNNHCNYGKTGHKSKLYGRKKPQSWIDMISKLHKGKILSQETKDKISRKKKGVPRPQYLKLRQSILLRGRKGRALTDEMKYKISLGVSKAILDGKLNNTRFKRGVVYSDKSDKPIYCRSEYEFIAIRIFDNDDSIVKIEYEPEKILILLDNVKRYTIPDFRITYVSNKIKIIEIKPLRVIKNNTYRSKDKIRETIKHYASIGIRYEVWTEKKLGLPIR